MMSSWVLHPPRNLVCTMALPSVCIPTNVLRCNSGAPNPTSWACRATVCNSGTTRISVGRSQEKPVERRGDGSSVANPTSWACGAAINSGGTTTATRISVDGPELRQEKPVGRRGDGSSVANPTSWACGATINSGATTTGTTISVDGTELRQEKRVGRPEDSSSVTNPTSWACGAAINSSATRISVDGRPEKPVTRRVDASSVATTTISVDQREFRQENPVAQREDRSLETDIVVVGAGLAGLAAAQHFASSGSPFLLIEASDAVGGRVRTDRLHGFLLDRGFQIFITAYPLARQILDYPSLRLQPFYSGALVWFNGSFHRVSDPLRHLLNGLLSLLNPVGTPLDKLLVGFVRLRAASRSDDDILSAPETSIVDRLASDGFSASMVDRFFRPFFGGIFFDNQLRTTSRLFDFVFKCLALGSNTLPAEGIGAIPQQIADRLPQGSILLNSDVVELVWGDDGHPTGVKLKDGRFIKSKHGIVLAVDGPAASQLLGEKLPATPSLTKPPRSTVCIYFAADKAPIKEPILLLNGSGKGIVNNMFFPTTVAPSYSPPGKVLVSVSLVGLYEEKSDSDLEQSVRAELSDWFGATEVGGWEHLRTYRIKLAQPHQEPPTDLRKDARVQNGVYICGDHRDSATFDGALMSGRRAAQALLEDSKLVVSRG